MSMPAPIVCRGVRGAVIVDKDEREAILSASRDLMAKIIEANQIEPADIASVLFTTTADITAANPAAGARQIGLTDAALMCMRETSTNSATDLARCIRVLVHWNTHKTQSEMRHVYLGEAATLRPERAWSAQQ